MFVVLVRAVRWTVVVIWLVLSVGFPVAAQSQSLLRGRITDPLGQAVPNAKILVLQHNKEGAHNSSSAEGAFEVTVPDRGRYDVEVEAQGFAPTTVSSVFVASGQTTEIPTVNLSIGPL